MTRSGWVCTKCQQWNFGFVAVCHRCHNERSTELCRHRHREDQEDWNRPMRRCVCGFVSCIIDSDWPPKQEVETPDYDTWLSITVRGQFMGDLHDTVLLMMCPYCGTVRDSHERPIDEEP